MIEFDTSLMQYLPKKLQRPVCPNAIGLQQEGVGLLLGLWGCWGCLFVWWGFGGVYFVVCFLVGFCLFWFGLVLCGLPFPTLFLSRYHSV